MSKREKEKKKKQEMSVKNGTDRKIRTEGQVAEYGALDYLVISWACCLPLRWERRWTSLLISTLHASHCTTNST
jgi:hypothetical protein